MWKALSSLFGAQPTQKKNKYLDAIEYGLRSVEESPFADLQASTQEISEIIKEKSLGIFGARLEVDPINKLILRIFIGPETGDYIQLATFTLSAYGTYPVSINSQFESYESICVMQSSLRRHLENILSSQKFARELRALFISHQIT